MSAVLNAKFPALAAFEKVRDCEAVVPHGMFMTNESFEIEPFGALPTVMFIVVVSLL